MNAKNYVGVAGSVFVIAGGMSPMLRIPIIGNWNYWDLDITLASVVFILAALGLIASVTARKGLLRFCGWGILVVIIITLLGVYLKVNDAFSFIPLKKLASAAAGLVKYRWLGWSLLFAGSALMIVSGRNEVKAV